MHRKKHGMYRVQYCPQFQESAGALGTYPPQIMEGHHGMRGTDEAFAMFSKLIY